MLPHRAPEAMLSSSAVAEAAGQKLSGENPVRALHACSGNRPVVALGFAGFRRLAGVAARPGLKYGAETGRAVVTSR